MGRFDSLQRSAQRIEKGTIGTGATHPEVPSEAPESSDGGSLKDKLGSKQAAGATVRMSVEMPVEMHKQITAISLRSGLPKAGVVREILKETLPELI